LLCLRNKFFCELLRSRWIDRLHLCFPFL
jgi:hypothetical protein